MPYRRFPFLNLFSPFFPLRQGQAPLLGGSSHAPYRFGEMIQKAEPCADVKALGRAMLAALGEGWTTALILSPPPDGEQLLKTVAIEFGLDVAGLDALSTRAALNQFLITHSASGRDAVLIIDEAQNLTNHQLEHIRLLSNLETDDRKLLQIVLMGQPELRARLDDPILRQLRQRITVRFHLAPLTRAELWPYIEHRLVVSGATGTFYFTAGALWRIYNYSRGIPRLVNAVCDKCLLAGYVEESHGIDFRLVGRAVRELEGRINV